MTKRLISSLCIIAGVVLLLSRAWLTGLGVTVLVLVGLYEFFTMLEHKGISLYKYFGTGMGAILPLSIMLRFELTKSWELLFIVIGLLFLILMQFRRRDNSGVVVDISTTIFGILYVAWFLSFLIRIRYLPNGMWLLTSVILITKLGDIGAYLVGSRLGKRALLPRVSPKKTIEGSVGGLVFSVAGALLSKSLLGFSYLHLILLGVCLGIIGQLGDLSESLMKRDCQVKDSGTWFPGMGGVLDIVDSLLFTGPVFYLYMVVTSA
jgi:phosphatidate cytidylyltransferase